jgi:ribosomal protein L4
VKAFQDGDVFGGSVKLSALFVVESESQNRDLNHGAKHGILVDPTVGAEEHTKVVMTVGVAVSDTRRQIRARTGGVGFGRTGKRKGVMQGGTPGFV